MKIIVSFIGTGFLWSTNNERGTQLVRIYQSESGEVSGDCIDMASGSSDCFYDVAEWAIESALSVGPVLLEYLANNPHVEMLSPVYDPHGIFA